MRFIKLAFISVILISVLLTGFSLLLPSHVRISRAIDINADSEQIIPYIKDLDQWPLWNAMVTDTSIKMSKISSEKIETNWFNIYKQSSTADSVSTRWLQSNGKEFHGNFSCMKGAQVTVLQWYFDFHLKWYPWEKFGSIIYDDRMGPGMEKSLMQLKALVETSP